MLLADVQAALLSRKAYAQACEDAAALPTWERAVKSLALLSSKLRLNPHARSDPKTVARRSQTYVPSAYKLLMGEP